MTTKIFRRTGFEDTPIVSLQRVVGLDGVALTQAGVASIARTVWDLGTSKMDDPPSQVAAGTGIPVVADTIFDTLQTDNGWTEDTTGYNFRDVVPAVAFPDAGHRYRVEYLLTLAGGVVIAAPVDYDTVGLMGS